MAAFFRSPPKTIYYLCPVKYSLLISFLILLGFSPLLSCRENADLEDLQLYEGPINEGTNILLTNSDSAIHRSEIKAPKQLEFKNGNLHFPEGISIEFYTKEGLLETTMRADRGYFIKDKNLYRGEGNVQIENLLKEQKLQTEEIFWNQAEKKIFTEKFVTIQEKQTLFKGTGMEADDSFRFYQLKKASGRLPLEGN